MTSSIHLGRIAGIRVGINYSWFIIAALLMWMLAVGVFPRATPGLDASTYWAMAAAAALLFFGSILAHELGHAIQARREGMEMDEITLWIFGGVARFRGMFPSAGAEFRIAIAGPLVTVAVIVIAGAAGALPLAVPIAAVAAWLAYINIILLVFNMLPALPLDGGRVLRAALWHARRDFAGATRVAGAAGRAFGIGLIGFGAVMVLLFGAIGGLWLVLIGWFLQGAADMEVRAMVAHESLGGLRVADLMTTDPVTTSPDTTIDEVMDGLAWAHRHTTYPVVDAMGHPVGLVIFRRIAQSPRDEWSRMQVRDCMLPGEEVPMLDPADRVVDVLDRVLEGEGRRALVVQGGRLVGLLSPTDISRALQSPPRPPPPPATAAGDPAPWRGPGVADRGY
jgi:Zn-dependent protease/predicted transcriptional regulator